MKKSLKILLISLFCLLTIGICKDVQANSISEISMDIYVDSNGDATITETWECSVQEGTEVYHPYYNLGNSKIENLKVSENGKQYETLSSWNTSGSLSTKAYKCGINKIANGVELCWGISKYGSHTYKVQYRITEFVSKTTDYQMIYWTLIPYDFSNEIGNVKIEIYTDFSIPNTTDVWGYGNYGGLCYVNNGKIFMDSDGTLDKDEYMTILAKFPAGTFNTQNELDYDFSHFLNMAEAGAILYDNGNNSYFGIKEVLTALTTFIIHVSCIIIPMILVIAFTVKSTIHGAYGFKFGEAGRIIKKDIEYYRDIPCKGDIFRAYYIAYQYGQIKNKTDILGAIILKWIKEGIIRTENREGGKIFKKEETIIMLGENPTIKLNNQKESELFRMMYEASIDGILENKEFESWCRKSYSKILNWFDDILEEERKKLVDEGMITCEDKFFGKSYTATQNLKNEAMQIAGLKRFLLEYTLIKDRYAIEVELFENYLIYAQMMGIATQVSKQFKELYPDMIEQTHYSSYDNIVYINYCTSRGISSANSARMAAESYSSGGGGFSSGGGGGGSFGGGGGRRRFPLKFIKKS